MKLKGKVAVITGGGSGIGLATAKEFKSEGASIVISGRNAKTLEEAAKQLGDNVLSITADTSKLSDLEQLFKEVEDHFGKIDVLFANAGDVKFMPIDQFDEEIFDYITTNSFKGSFFTIQKALPHLNNKASIIVNSATGQSLGFPGSTVAAANKAAIRSLARGVSADLLSSHGIRANCISPGPIDTPLFDKVGIPKEQVADVKRGFAQQIPLKRMGTPEEVAKVALFLASDDSSFVIGEEIQVGGGENNFRV